VAIDVHVCCRVPTDLADDGQVAQQFLDRGARHLVVVVDGGELLRVL
jgi:hypothetical protein